MIKIGITGSIASGKSSVAKLISKRRYLIFNADKAVATLYKKKYFIKKVKNKFNIKETKNIKKKIKNILNKNRKKLKELEHIIHPLVRKEMNFLIKTKKKQKILIFDIPLLIENKLMKNFDIIVFVGAKRSLRLRRYLKKGGDKKIFTILDKRQMSSMKKIKISDYVIYNNSSLKMLKKKTNIFMKKYE